MVSSLLRRITVPAALAALIVLAGASLNRVYNGQLLVALVAGAAAGSVLISALLRRAPSWLVAPASVLALLGYGLYAVRVSAQAGAIPGEVTALALDAARNAVPRLLTALIPVEPQPDTVLAPVVLAWLAGFAAAELAERAQRPALGLVPPALLYAGALVLVGPNAPAMGWQPLAFAAVAAVALVAAAASSGARSLPTIGRTEAAALRLRTASGLAAGLVAVLAMVALVAPIVAGGVGRVPADPRRYVQPPNLDVLDENPLIRLAGWATNPDQPLFDVAVLSEPRADQPAPAGTPSPTPSGDTEVVAIPPDDEEPAADPAAAADVELGAHDTRLRLAVLDEWDGVTWHASADYRSAGRVLPAPQPPPGYAGDSELAPPARIEERITVDQLAGRLLPAIAAPQRVDGVRVAYDQRTATLLRTDPLQPGVSYTVTSVNPSVDVNLLPAADVPSGPAVAPLLAVGDTVPPDLGALAEKIVADEGGSPYLRASAIEAFLAEHYRFAADAPSGHAYPNLRFFLLEPGYVGGGRGTSEQFAAAYATLGRLVGLPTRVVVGFRTPAGGGTVTAADALAWPEVLFAGVGWVPFDPMPDPDVPPRDLEDEYLPKATPETTPPETAEPSAPSTTAVIAPPSAGVSSGPAVFAVGVVAGGVSAGLGLLVLLLLAAIVLARWLLSRRRLRRGTPPQRVLGAWQEVLDALRLAGRPPPGHLAAAEVAVHAMQVARSGPGRSHARRPRPAVPPLEDLAAKVNAVGFAGSAPAGVATDELGAHSATVQAVAYARALRARRPWWRRLWWRVDPRPLRQRSR